MTAKLLRQKWQEALAIRDRTGAGHAARQYVQERLKALGIPAHAEAMGRLGFALCVRGHWLEVRGSLRHMARKHVTTRGRRYIYHYPHILFNRHVRGKLVDPRPEFWAFVNVTDGVIYVVPDAKLGTRPTVDLLCTKDRKPRGAVLDGYRERWDLLAVRAA